MAVVEQGSCEGCGETYHVDDLHVVTINGEEMICCEDCRRHAERAAERAQPTCEGCGDPTPDDELRPVELPDGVEIQCCPDCRTEASVDITGDSTTADTGTAGSTDPSGPSSGRRSRKNTRSTSGGTTDESRGGSGGETAPKRSPGEESRPATTENICDNCQESFTIELYRVETIDGRTEEFCPECKRKGIEEGIVRDVQLRRAQAFEALGLNSAADEDDVREAYLRRVKEVHPDREDGSRSEFMLVKRAYERLSGES